jgi:acetoin utilization deacetylase AcuC-like enzyme
MNACAAWCPEYVLTLPERHPFPMIKYQLLRKQLHSDGIVSEEAFFAPTTPNIETLLRVHHAAYLEQLLHGTLSIADVRKTGFPQSPEVLTRELLIVGGTIQAAQIAMKHGIAFNLAGGTHHAHPGFGAAYCLLNDVGIAATYAVSCLGVSRVLIVDLDVHQGDGTAAMFADSTQIFTFCMHGAGLWPRSKHRAYYHISVPEGTKGPTYLNMLEKALHEALFLIKPDLMFYIAGADVLHGDKLGNLALTEEDCRLRDALVFALCSAHNIPVAVVMGGGYAPSVQAVVNVHKNTFREGLSLYTSG